MYFTAFRSVQKLKQRYNYKQYFVRSLAIPSIFPSIIIVPHSPSNVANFASFVHPKNCSRKSVLHRKNSILESISQNRCDSRCDPGIHTTRGIFVSHFSKEPALSRDLQIVSRNAEVFVRVGRDYISRRRIEFRDDFGVDSLRGRNYNIT